MPSSPKPFKRIFLPVLLLFVLAAVLVRMAYDPSFDQGLREAGGMLDPHFLSEWWRVGRVMELAHQNYLDPKKVPYNKLADSALDHVLDGIDRYTVYMAPADYQDFNLESDQRFVGVGVEIERRNGRIQIVHVFDNSPAFKAGWKPLDRIVKIGDTDVSDYSVSDVSSLLKGPEGTTVSVTRERPGESKYVDSLTRGGFDIPYVRDLRGGFDIQLLSGTDSAGLSDTDGVGYLRITQFGGNTGQEFTEALRNLTEQGMRGLVIDLRDNPGGLLDATAEVLNPLLPAGQLVVSTRGRNNKDDGSVRIEGAGDVHFAGPVVVLVNDNSASAAEIVAGALQDTRRAVIVGERTYGKGVVQTVMPVLAGGGMRITTEAYFLPSGRTIQDKGITPDIPITLSPEMRDLLRVQRSELRYLKSDEFAADYGFSPVPDPQLETAIGLLRAVTPPGVEK